MPESIQLQVRLRAYARKESKRWVAICPSIGVASQGRSAADARRCLDEAVQLWFESCLERGTLERALQEVGFRPASRNAPAEADVVSVAHRMEDVRGEAFPVHVSIPAYQAAAILSAES